ncbi:MAG: helix-turn-helix transcriptional regulator [Phycisphaeraceae bacterium]|nr:helix-turn-helix transcriptional regulator [Phycisphaeraceae bacterium]
MIQRLGPAVDFMNTNAQNNPSLREIAAIVYLSPSHFHRLFQAAFSLTPHQYMLEKRMNKATKLLVSGRLRVSEVATLCGYDNLFYFSRIFKKYHGYTPTIMRNNSMPMQP